MRVTARAVGKLALHRDAVLATLQRLFEDAGVHAPGVRGAVELAADARVELTGQIEALVAEGVDQTTRPLRLDVAQHARRERGERRAVDDDRIFFPVVVSMRKSRPTMLPYGCPTRASMLTLKNFEPIEVRVGVTVQRLELVLVVRVVRRHVPAEAVGLGRS